MRLERPIAADALAAIRAPFTQTGAAPIDPPVIQPLNLLLDLAGEAMRARLFIVQDEGGREACLRPDFTVAVAGAHIAEGRTKGRYFYEGRAFRVAPPGAGAHYPEEFLQLGLEIFGEPSGPQADAVVLGAAWNAAAAGGRDDLALRLGDVALFGAVLEALDVLPAMRERLQRALGRPRQLEQLLQRAGASEAPAGALGDIAHMPHDQAVAAIEALWRDQGLEATGGRSASEIAERLAAQAHAARAPRLTPGQSAMIDQYLALEGTPQALLSSLRKFDAAPVRAAVADWETRLAALEAAGVDLARAHMASRFSRAFGYYDGFLFEIVSPALPDGSPISAGGRYDGVTERLGGAAATAVGCMVRPARAWKEAGR